MHPPQPGRSRAVKQCFTAKIYALPMFHGLSGVSVNNVCKHAHKRKYSRIRAYTRRVYTDQVIQNTSLNLLFRNSLKQVRETLCINGSTSVFPTDTAFSVLNCFTAQAVRVHRQRERGGQHRREKEQRQRRKTHREKDSGSEDSKGTDAQGQASYHI